MTIPNSEFVFVSVFYFKTNPRYSMILIMMSSLFVKDLNEVLVLRNLKKSDISFSICKNRIKPFSKKII